MQKSNRNNVHLSEGWSWMMQVMKEWERWEAAAEGSVGLGSQIFKEVFRQLSNAPAVFMLLII